MIASLEIFDAYARRHTSAEPELLQRLREEAYRTTEMPQMLAGHLQGRLLALITRISGARKVLEIGTFVGYSALCFAEALPEDGRVITVDRDAGIRDIAQRYFDRAPYGRKISLKIGDALKVLGGLKGPFDLVYIDADKVNYAAYYDAVFDKIPGGGLILADNILWSGRVIDAQVKDKDTAALRAFAKKIREDRRVEAALLTVRDGLYLIRKRQREKGVEA